MSKHSNKRLFILTFIALFFIFLSSYLINNKDQKFGVNPKAAVASKEEMLANCLTKCIEDTQVNETQFMKDVAEAKCNLTCQRDVMRAQVTDPGLSGEIESIKTPSRAVVPTIPAQIKPYFSFEKTDFTATVDEEFKVKTLINTFKGVPIISADMIIKYDSNMLELIEVGDMSALFQDGPWKTNENSIYITRLTTTTGRFVDVEGKNVFASLKFRPKKTGNAILMFDCVRGDTGDSNIILNNTNSDDIIDCSKNNQTTIRITTK